MARALRVISVERGYDPANFTLVAFGGAGPLHACDLADALGIPQVLVPTAPGVLSAAGMLISDITRDAEQGLHLTIGPADAGSLARLDEAFSLVAGQARAAIGEDGYDSNVRIELAADLRYLGQSHELTVSLNQGGHAQSLRNAFHEAHIERFGFSNTDTPVEVVTARAKARHDGYDGDLGGVPAASSSQSQTVNVTWDQPRPTNLISRQSVQDAIAGPAIITQVDTTVTVPPGWSATPLPSASLLLKRDTG